MNRTYDACGRTTKNYGSLARHIAWCPVHLGKKQRTIPRPELFLQESEILQMRNEVPKDAEEIEGNKLLGSVAYDDYLDSIGMGEDERDPEVVEDKVGSFRG